MASILAWFLYIYKLLALAMSLMNGKHTNDCKDEVKWVITITSITISEQF